MKTQIPFPHLLALVQKLSPEEKAKLREVLSSESEVITPDHTPFINFLLHGPVYSEKDIAQIEENRKSISAWRTEK